ncbi:3-hydroxyacyl-CoA dehydrogenase family protein [Halobacillus naozhouensis]|uniref:3-hydroxyacyl-CoA dehydrogenase family protein n=1 Tax=Halobacillus naozhouensis TaxID=554880 RepID=A0ABY8IW73_9BACI|nr:3-hydroxyacyl-CoA dehydrogenase family protein [Halobacillus naozhouensis]WFT73981.1 3-hydroxyacyl-CoA dehydrogenase family protein [Halobacillus naozhouensis]
MHDIKEVAVIGAGAMGSQIAMVCALHGYSVILNDISEDSLAKAKESLQGHMNRRIQKGKLTDQQVEEAFGRLTFEVNLASVKDVDLVIEAVVEKLDIKRELFSTLDDITSDHTILATNSSTIVSSKIADATTKPDKVCNVHFFNPPLVMELVEVVQGPHTSEETAQTAYAFVEQIGKVPVLLKKEISGFIANRILGKLMDEAVFLLENGYATHEEIDTVCTKALNHPIGPFALMDLTGIDVNYFVRMQRYQESGDEADQPAKLIQEKVEKGELGRKTGKGFYQYS